MHSYLDFEKTVANLEGRIHELRSMAESDNSVDLNGAIEKLETKVKSTLHDLYRKLTPWHKTLVARHPDRPHFIDYVEGIATDYVALSGDRNFSEDPAIQAGFGKIDGYSVAIIGHEKGKDTKTRLKYNFGMAKPEGYRKAVRIMQMAERFSIPVITLIDTAGAYPGIGAEERGQAEAIARSTEACLNLKVPIISVIIGEGGSGGAIAIAAANKIYMLEHAIYSVISPEAGASILWHNSNRAQDVATSMKITAQHIIKLGIIDEIIEEPVGGAHRDPDAIIAATGKAVRCALTEFRSKSGKEILEERRKKFLEIGRNLL